MKENYKENNNFDSIIRQKMTGLESVPAFDAWDKIAAELDNDKSPSPKIWWRTGSVLRALENCFSWGVACCQRGA